MKVSGSEKIDLTKGVVVGQGHNLNDRYSSELLFIPTEDRAGHFWNFGTTRVGKTREIEYMIEQDILNGLSVIYLDPKDDKDIFSKIMQVALSCGRGDEVMLVAPVYPQFSAVVNPLHFYYMPEELVGTIVSCVDVGKEKFFYNVAYEISLVLVMAILMIRKHQKKTPIFNLNDIKNLISRNELIKLQAQVAAIDDPSSEHISSKLLLYSEYVDLPENQQLTVDMQKIIDSPADFYSKVSSSLRTALMELTTGNIGLIIGRARENNLIKRLEEGKRVICVVQMNSAINRKAAFTMGKSILSMTQNFMGRLFASGRKCEPPLSIYMDEAQDMVYVGFHDYLAKGGGANIFLHGFSQSVNMMYAAIGKDFTNAILDNANTKQFMRAPDFSTAKFASEQFGTRDKFAPMMNFGAASTARQVEDDVIKPREVQDLRKREFYLSTYSGCYKGRTIDVSPLRLRIEVPRIRVAGE